MQLIRGLHRWPGGTDSVITIGNFDGVHLGHQAMFDAVRAAADIHRLPATVISFEPLPHEYFAPLASPSRLQGLRDRISSIRATGMDRLLLLNFDHAQAAQSAEDFIAHVLLGTLRAKHIVIGDDFRFGHQRTGTAEMLHRASRIHGFTVEQSPTCMRAGARVSSTRVREHLRRGELDAVTSLLGRPYRISGRVVHGEKVGRQLGFPTANVALGVLRPALRGVYAVWTHDLDTGARHAAVANLGERPTLGGRKLLLEVHLLDYHAESRDEELAGKEARQEDRFGNELYGHHLAVDFLTQIRHEQRFASLDELKAQIGRDADAARELTRQR